MGRPFLVAIGLCTLSVCLFLTSLWDTQALPIAGRGTQCLFDARGGNLTVLHIVLGTTLKGRAPALLNRYIAACNGSFQILMTI